MLVVVSHTVLCIVVHVLTSIEKRIAFIRIEKSVVAHIDVQQEIAKQVRKIMRQKLIMLLS